MSTLTFLRKFTARFVLGLAVLATPNLVLAHETGEGDGGQTPPNHPPGRHEEHHSGTTGDGQNNNSTSQNHDGGEATIHFSLSPGTIDQLTTILSQLGSGGCSGLAAASSALSSLDNTQ